MSPVWLVGGSRYVDQPRPWGPVAWQIPEEGLNRGAHRLAQRGQQRQPYGGRVTVAVIRRR